MRTLNNIAVISLSFFAFAIPLWSQQSKTTQSENSATFYEKTEKRVLGKAKEDTALVYFIRTGWIGGAVKFWVFADDEPLGVLPSKSYAYAYLKPGTYNVWASAENVQPYLLEARAGETYYFVLEAKMGVWKAQVDLSSVSEGQAKGDLAMCKYYATLTEKGKKRGNELAAKRYDKMKGKMEGFTEEEFVEEDANENAEQKAPNNDSPSPK
jgi:hypothetical protein